MGGEKGLNNFYILQAQDIFSLIFLSLKSLVIK